MWPELDDVATLDHNYADPFFVPWIFPRYFPCDYGLIMKSGFGKIKVDAKWPNAISLLSDMINRCPSSDDWYGLGRMRREVEKWKEEVNYDLVTPS
jgi:hypothetical protein